MGISAWKWADCDKWWKRSMIFVRFHFSSVESLSWVAYQKGNHAQTLILEAGGLWNLQSDSALVGCMCFLCSYRLYGDLKSKFCLIICHPILRLHISLVSSAATAAWENRFAGCFQWALYLAAAEQNGMLLLVPFWWGQKCNLSSRALFKPRALRNEPDQGDRSDLWDEEGTMVGCS